MDAERMLLLCKRTSSLSASLVKYARIKEGVNKIWCLTISRPFGAPADWPLRLPRGNGEEKQSWKHSLSRRWPSRSQVLQGTRASDNALVRPRCCSTGMPGDKGGVFWIVSYEQVWESGRGAAMWQGSPCLHALPRAGKGICGDHLWFLFLTPPKRTDPESCQAP